MADPTQADYTQFKLSIVDSYELEKNFKGGWAQHWHPEGEECWHDPADIDADGVLWVGPSKGGK